MKTTEEISDYLKARLVTEKEVEFIYSGNTSKTLNIVNLTAGDRRKKVEEILKKVMK